MREPKASSRMTIATSRPIPWEVSGPAPAESSMVPEPPTVRSGVFAFSRSCTTESAWLAESVVRSNVTVA